MKKLSRKEWLKELPITIYNLCSKYNFYFSGRYSIISKDILDVMKNFKKKRSSGLVLYKTQNSRFFFIIYTKKGDTVYYTDDYKGATWKTVKYFVKKFNDKYEEADKARFYAKCGVQNESK